MTSVALTSIDSQDYKNAMRHLGGATCVITTSHQGQKTGLTATSVTSVAAEPALKALSVIRMQAGHSIMAFGS